MMHICRTECEMWSGMMRVHRALCSKSLAHIKDSEELGPMKLRGDILNDRQWVGFLLNGTIEVFGWRKIRREPSFLGTITMELIQSVGSCTWEMIPRWVRSVSVC